ncbi:hypothetical protein PHMEG_00020779 [Phytophthora megakarya]|uniref:Uncharacterized protein n=1 Tax=Phytophthora megakarya TaxID=4795 RepID=A0A225VNB4_9STRA|nr:hypothetical protein PHMEG_00020779 [Phytophthora megakarya]
MTAKLEELYCGAAQYTAKVDNVPTSQLSADPNARPSAVTRKLDTVLPTSVEKVFHLVIINCFYTSVQLAFQLLHRSVYRIGTIQGDKLGYPQEIVEIIEIDLNEFPMMEVANNCPGMTGLVWWNRKPVQFLGTGSNRAMEIDVLAALEVGSTSFRVLQWLETTIVGWEELTCMTNSGCNTIRYSYKPDARSTRRASLLGLVDVAIMNGYIVFKEAREGNGNFDCFYVAHTVQCSSTEAFPPLGPDQEYMENLDYQIVKSVRKRRQRQCKVCSIKKRHIGDHQATK